MESLVSGANLTWLIVLLSALGALLTIHFYDKRHVVLMEDLRRISVHGSGLVSDVEEQKLGIAEVKEMIDSAEQEVFVMEQQLEAKTQEYQSVSEKLTDQMESTTAEVARMEDVIRDQTIENEKLAQELEAWKIKLTDVALAHDTVLATQRAMRDELLNGLAVITENMAEETPFYQKVIADYEGDATGMLIAKIELLEHQVRYWQDQVALGNPNPDYTKN